MFRLFALLLICVYTNCLCRVDAFPRTVSVDDLKLLQAAALRYALNGQLDRSISLQEKAVALAGQEYGANSPAVADMYFHLGALALEASEFQKAQDALSRSVQINPSSVAARIKLAEILRLRGHPQAAQQQAYAAVDSHKLAPEARLQLALCYLDLGNMAKANQQFFNLSQVLSGKSPINSESVTITRLKPYESKKPDAVYKPDTAYKPGTAYLRPGNSKKRSSRVRPNGSARVKKTHPGATLPPPPQSYPGVVPIGSQNAPSARTPARSQKQSHAARGGARGEGGAKGEGVAGSEGGKGESTQSSKGAESAVPSSQSSDFLLDWASVKKKQ